jgi:cytochrome c peroxidase
VIDHYDEGLRNNASLNPALAMTMGTGLMLNETDKDALIAFLKTLTDTSLIQDSRYASPF